MIVGWRVASHMRTDMVLDALEMARGPGARRSWAWSPTPMPESIHVHPLRRTSGRVRGDPRSAPSPTRSTTPLRRRPTALYKTEPSAGPATPWKNVDDVELATLAWVHWYNNERLHGYCNDVPPAEFEAAYAAQQTDHPLVGIQ